MPGREVDEVGGGEAEVDDVDALRVRALGEGGGELDAVGSHVPPDEHLRARLGEPGEGGADRPTMPASSWSGTVPRMSYALKIGARSGMAGRPYGVGCYGRGDRLRRPGRVVGARRGPASHPEQVADQANRLGRPPATTVRSAGLDGHGDLDQRQAVALDQVQHLDVEGEAVDDGRPKISRPTSDRNALQPALRVADWPSRGGRSSG